MDFNSKPVNSFDQYFYSNVLHVKLDSIFTYNDPSKVDSVQKVKEKREKESAYKNGPVHHISLIVI